MSTLLKTIVVTTLIAISSSAAMAAQTSGRGGGGGGGGGGSDPDQPLSYGCLTHGYGCNPARPVLQQAECSPTRVLEQVGYNSYRWVYRCEVPRTNVF